MQDILFKRIDNSALIFFRIVFGCLCFLESVGAIFTGWVKRAFIDPDFTFTFIGFEWLQPLPGYGMYLYYLIMGLFGLGIAVGYKYRYSAFGFTLMWTITYLMQKSSYNNHYYLLILLSAMMIFIPAHKYYSIDVKKNPSIKEISMPQWCKLIFIVQMFIVYTYGAIAKLYPDWLDTTVVKGLMQRKKDYWLIGDFLQNEWLHYFVSYGGILFDGLVIPLLIYKPTRKLAFFASVFFHLFNSFVFQVGIFPYLSLAFTVFFFDPKFIQETFFKKKEFYDKSEIVLPPYKNMLTLTLSVYFIFQIGLPLRHWAFKDNVLWTEEGHRMSWRMMLRSKFGRSRFDVVDKETQEKTRINLNEYLSSKQKSSVSTRPDMIWQFAQKLKKEYAKKGKDVSVFVDCKISVNGRPLKRLIDQDVDLAAQKWHPFKHSDWLLPSNLYPESSSKHN